MEHEPQFLNCQNCWSICDAGWSYPAQEGSMVTHFWPPWSVEVLHFSRQAFHDPLSHPPSTPPPPPALCTGSTFSEIHFILTYLQWQSGKQKVRPPYFINEQVVSNSQERKHTIPDTGQQSQRVHRPSPSCCPTIFEGGRIRGVSFTAGAEWCFPHWDFTSWPIRKQNSKLELRWATSRAREDSLQRDIQISFHYCMAVRDSSWTEARPWLFCCCFLLSVISAKGNSAVLWRVQPSKATWGCHSGAMCESLYSEGMCPSQKTFGIA